MNNWDEIKKLAIVEADDFQDRWDRNGLDILFYWKTKYPKFKITLFTIPDRTGKEMRDLVSRNSDWIEIAVHGFNHESNFECYSWDYDKTKALMHRTYKMTGEHEEPFYDKVFKAPGWTITSGYNGYPAGEHLPIHKDPQCVYNALKDMNFLVFDRHYNKPARPKDLKVVCVDCNPDIVHMHTWNMETGDKNGRNGFRQVEEEHGVPWDRDTEFKFVSEAWDQKLFKPCQNS